MPRNGSGIYSKPAGTTASPNTVIESAKYNSQVDDMVDDLNAARPITAGGTGATSASSARTGLEVDKKVVYAAKTGAYTAVAADNNAVHRFTDAGTVTLTAAATLAANWHYTVIADGGARTIDPDGSETINGAATLVIPDGNSAFIICTGAAFEAVLSASLSSKNTFTKTQIWAKGADVASATALALGDDGNYFDVTGTTAITSIGTVGVGAVIKLHFDGILTLTHHSTDLVLPGGANITTAAGDEAEFVEYAAGDWRCTNYQRASVIPDSNAWKVIGDPIRTATSVPSVDITDLGDFAKLRITGKLFTANDAVNVQVRTSTDNGSTFAASSGDYADQVIHSAGTTTTSALFSGASGTGVYLAAVTGVGNTANEALSFCMVIDQFNKTEYAFFDVSGLFINSTGALVRFTCGGTRSDATARNALRIIASAGNIASISYTVEGIRG